MAPQTVDVPHLGGVAAGYQLSGSDPSLPTLVMSNSFLTSTKLYEEQFSNKDLTSKVNLLAVEPLGHGSCRVKNGNEQFTYWDSAIVALQVLDALKIKKAFALGTSQGGWIVTRMALLAPDRIQGIIPLGTSMDYESAASRELGCWDASAINQPAIDSLSSSGNTPDFVIPKDTCNAIIDLGFGKDSDQKFRDKWIGNMQETYKGDLARRMMLMSSINLADRDGLLNRIHAIKCAVLWMHGTSDPVYSVKAAQEHIKHFTNAPDVQLKIYQGGQHFLSASNAEIFDEIVPWIQKHNQA